MVISRQDLYQKDPEEFTKEDAKMLVEDPETPGLGRGEHLLIPLKQIRQNKGEESFKRVLKEMETLGYPINPEQLDALGWYPVGLRALMLVVLKKIFGLKDEDFMKLGEEAVAFSFIVRFFFKYFQSRRMAFKHTPDYWAKHYTCGRLEPVEFKESDQENYFTMRLHDFKVHPLFCPFFRGYFLQVSKLLGGANATIEETKCMFKGDPYHEFLVKWE